MVCEKAAVHSLTYPRGCLVKALRSSQSFSVDLAPHSLRKCFKISWRIYREPNEIKTAEVQLKSQEFMLQWRGAVFLPSSHSISSL